MTLRALSVAPLHWSSGYDDLLLAVRGAVDRGIDVSLRVEADGPARQRVVYTVFDLGLDDRVVFARGRDVGWDGLADALVLAAVDDREWPAVAAAADRALTVVATDLPWARAHLVRPGRDVRLVPARSPAALVSALTALASPTQAGGR